MHERRHYAVSGAWPASLRPSNADVAVHPSSKMARKVARMHAAGRHDGAAELRATFLAGRGLTGAAVLAALTVAGELTAEDAASAAGCHRTTAARHVDAAVDAGVAYTRTEATTGRPRTVYVLAATEAETLGIGGAASGYVLANAHKTVRDAKADRAWANRMVLDGAVATFGEAVEEVRAARQFERTTPDRGRVDPVRLGEAVGAVACHLRRMRGEDSEADQAAPVRARSRPPDAEAAIDACMVGAWA